jgi:hypothetical protein
MDPDYPIYFDVRAKMSMPSKPQNTSHTNRSFSQPEPLSVHRLKLPDPHGNYVLKSRPKIVDVEKIETLRLQRGQSAAIWLQAEREKRMKPEYEKKIKPREILRQQMDAERRAARMQNTLSTSGISLKSKSDPSKSFSSTSGYDHPSQSSNMLASKRSLVLSDPRLFMHDTSTMKSFHEEANNTSSAATIDDKENRINHSNIDREVPKLSASHIDTKFLLKKLSELDVINMNVTYDSIPSPGVEIVPRKALATTTLDLSDEDDSFFYSRPVSAPVPAEQSQTKKNSVPSPTRSNPSDDYAADFDESSPKSNTGHLDKKTLPTTKFVSVKSSEGSDASDDDISRASDAITKKEREEQDARRKAAKQFLVKQRQKYRQDKEVEEKKKLEVEMQRKLKLASLDRKRRLKLQQQQASSSAEPTELSTIRSRDDTFSATSTTRSINPHRMSDLNTSIAEVVLQAPPRTEDLIPSASYGGVVDDFLNEFRHSRSGLGLASIELPRSLAAIPNPTPMPETFPKHRDQQTSPMMIYPDESMTSNRKPTAFPNVSLMSLSRAGSVNSTSKAKGKVKRSTDASSLNSTSVSRISIPSQTLKRATTPPPGSKSSSSFMRPTTSSVSRSRDPSMMLRSLSTGRSSSTSRPRRRRSATPTNTTTKQPIVEKKPSPSTSKSGRKKPATRSKSQTRTKTAAVPSSSIDRMKSDVTDLVATKERYSERLIDQIRQLDHYPSATRPSTSLQSIAPTSSDRAGVATPAKLDIVSTNVKNAKDVLAEVERMSAMLRELTNDLEEQVTAAAGSVRDSIDLDTFTTATGFSAVSTSTGVTAPGPGKSVLRQSLAEKIDAVLASVYDGNSGENLDDEEERDMHVSKESDLPSRLVNRSYEDADAVLMGEDDESDADKDADISSDDESSSSLQEHRDLLDRYNSDAAVQEILASVQQTKGREPESLYYAKALSDDEDDEQKPITVPPSVAASTTQPLTSLRNVGALGEMLNTPAIDDDVLDALDDAALDWSDDDDDIVDDSADLRMVTIFAKHLLEQKKKSEASAQADELREEMQARLPAAIAHIHEQKEQDAIRSAATTAAAANEEEKTEATVLDDHKFWERLLQREAKELPLSSSIDSKPIAETAQSRAAAAEPSQQSIMSPNSSSNKRLSPADMRMRVIEELRRQEIIMQAALELSDLQQAHTVQTAADILHQVIYQSAHEASIHQQDQELLLQQQAYELSLASAMNSAQRQLQEESLARDRSIEQLNLAYQSQQLQASYNLLVAQASQASRNLEQTSELLSMERQLSARTSQTNSAASPSTQSQSKPPSGQGKPPRPSVKGWSSQESLNDLPASSRSRSAVAAELDDSNVLFDDEESMIEEEENLAPHSSSAAMRSIEEEASSASRYRSISTNRSKAASSIASSIKEYSDTFDQVDDDIAEELSEEEEASVSRSRSSHPAAAVDDSYITEEYSAEFDELTPNPPSTQGAGTPSASLRRSQYSKPAAGAVEEETLRSSYRNDLDEIVGSYRENLDQQLRQVEVNFATKLSLLSTHQEKQLAYLSSKEAQESYPSVAAIREEEQRVQEEFLIAKAKLERDRWQVYIRAYKDLRQVKQLKKQADQSIHSIHTAPDLNESTSASESESESSVLASASQPSIVKEDAKALIKEFSRSKPIEKQSTAEDNKAAESLDELDTSIEDRKGRVQGLQAQIHKLREERLHWKELEAKKQEKLALEAMEASLQAEYVNEMRLLEEEKALYEKMLMDKKTELYVKNMKDLLADTRKESQEFNQDVSADMSEDSFLSSDELETQNPTSQPSELKGQSAMIVNRMRQNRAATSIQAYYRMKAQQRRYQAMKRQAQQAMRSVTMNYEHPMRNLDEYNAILAVQRSIDEDSFGSMSEGDSYAEDEELLRKQTDLIDVKIQQARDLQQKRTDLFRSAAVASDDEEECEEEVGESSLSEDEEEDEEDYSQSYLSVATIARSIEETSSKEEEPKPTATEPTPSIKTEQAVNPPAAAASEPMSVSATPQEVSYAPSISASSISSLHKDSQSPSQSQSEYSASFLESETATGDQQSSSSADDPVKTAAAAIVESSSYESLGEESILSAPTSTTSSSSSSAATPSKDSPTSLKTSNPQLSFSSRDQPEEDGDEVDLAMSPQKQGASEVSAVDSSVEEVIEEEVDEDLSESDIQTVIWDMHSPQHPPAATSSLDQPDDESATAPAAAQSIIQDNAVAIEPAASPLASPVKPASDLIATTTTNPSPQPPSVAVAADHPAVEPTSPPSITTVAQSPLSSVASPVPASPVASVQVVTPLKVEEPVRLQPLPQPRPQAPVKSSSSAQAALAYDPLTSMADQLADEIFTRLFTTVTDEYQQQALTVASPLSSRPQLDPPEAAAVAPVSSPKRSKDHVHVDIEASASSSPLSSPISSPSLTIHRLPHNLPAPNPTFPSSSSAGGNAADNVIHLKPWEANITMPASPPAVSSPPHPAPASSAAAAVPMEVDEDGLYDFDDASSISSSSASLASLPPINIPQSKSIAIPPPSRSSSEIFEVR